MCTPRAPGAPKELKQINSTPSSVTLQWSVDDPPGAPVESCTVCVAGAALAQCPRAQGRGPGGGFHGRDGRTGKWTCEITGLEVGTSNTWCTVKATNAVGEGRYAEMRVCASPAEGAPRAPIAARSGPAYTMYHGTSAVAAVQIRREGFRPSSGGMLGAGVYVSRDVQKARNYGPVVLTCRVWIGKVKRIDRQGHPLQKSWHSAGYDTAWVPPNCGMVPSGLEEDCVFDPSRIEVLD